MNEELPDFELDWGLNKEPKVNWEAWPMTGNVHTIPLSLHRVGLPWWRHLAFHLSWKPYPQGPFYRRRFRPIVTHHGRA